MIEWLKGLFVRTPTQKAQDKLIASVKKQEARKRGWTQKAHVRKGHYRTYKGGKQVWIPEQRINS